MAPCQKLISRHQERCLQGAKNGKGLQDVGENEAIHQIDASTVASVVTVKVDVFARLLNVVCEFFKSSRYRSVCKLVASLLSKPLI